MLNLAQATTAVTELLPGAKGEASAGATEAEKRKFEELRLKQRFDQGAGIQQGNSGQVRGDRVGKPPTEENPTLSGGKTYSQIAASAAKQAGELSTLVDAAKTELTTKMNQLTGGAKDSVQKLRDWITKTNVPVDPTVVNTNNPNNNNDTNLNPRPRGFSENNDTNLNPRPRGFSENLTADKMTANINQGVINVASTNDAKLDIGYKPNMSVDTSKISTPAETKAVTESTADKTTNADVVTSNAMLSAKMDDLIGLARSTNSYLQKISLKDYA
jgi:hypothetical protein